MISQDPLLPGLILIGYLLGSLASAVIVCKLIGLSDPRSSGSNNPGATNVLRLHGKEAAILTLAGDVLKGVLPVLLARILNAEPLIIALTGLAAFLGHLFPLFFGFKGGKGVATLVGVLIASHWLLGTAFILSWLFMAFLFRYSSLSALIASALAPFFSKWILGANEYVITFTLMAALLFWRHGSNIKHLMDGTEDKIGKK